MGEHVGKGIDLPFLCSSVLLSRGLELLNLQVHGNQKSMMQNLYYNLIEQDLILFPFLATKTTSADWICAGEAQASFGNEIK